MSTILFKVAAFICFIAPLAHELLGAPMVLPPLFETTLNQDVVWLHHFSWHVGSIAVLAMTGMYWFASMKPGNLSLAVVATLMSGGFGLLGISLGIFGSSVVWSTPAPYFWSLITVIGLFGIGYSEERHSR